MGGIFPWYLNDNIQLMEDGQYVGEVKYKITTLGPSVPFYIFINKMKE
jgi:hypothetical protein